MGKVIAAVFVCVLAAVAVAQTAASGGVTYEDLLARRRPAVDENIRYGVDADQYGELSLPQGKEAHPVVVVIHGGCWQEALPGIALMAPMADALRRRGFAVWNIEYRRLGREGGGYPGTFADIGNAADALRRFAPRYHLDLNRVVAVGHSAGGQLALWAAARAHLPKTSVLAARDPLPIRGVVSLAGIDDLRAYRAEGPSACGGAPTIDALVGAASRADPYSDTSPAALLPIGVRQIVISGSRDDIVPARFGHVFAARAKAAGDAVTDIEISDAGHFELIDPMSTAWPKVAAAVDELSR